MDTTALLSFLRQHPLAVQASVSALGPQAAVVGVAFTDRCEIVFDTLDSSRKAQNLRVNPRLAFVIGGTNPGDERTVQYEGTADEPSGPDLERLKEIYYGVYPDGRDRLSWRGLIYVRVTPTWVRYSDFNANPPLIVEFSGAQLSSGVSP